MNKYIRKYIIMAQNSKICIKCNKLFKTDYLLHKHVNRAISCDIVLQCERCKKIFTTNTKLVAHTKRKTPCEIFTVLLSDKIILVNAKEQAELNILNKKIIHKQQLAREAADTANKKIIHKQQLAREAADAANKKTELQKINRQHLAHEKQKAAKQELAKLEANEKMQDKRIAAALKIQELKFAGKFVTAKISNDRAAEEQKRLYLNNKAETDMEYEIMYDIAYRASKFTQNFFDEFGIDQVFRELCVGLQEEHCIEIFTNAETCTEIVHVLLRDILTHKDPKNKFLFYNSRIDLFCAITRETINGTKHTMLKKKTYPEVFDTLFPVIEFCYTRYNGFEIALYKYRVISMKENNEIYHKFERFNDERKTFADLAIHNRKYLTAPPVTPPKQMQMILHVPVPLQTGAKVLCNNLHTTITYNTNIYNPHMPRIASV